MTAALHLGSLEMNLIHERLHLTLGKLRLCSDKGSMGGSALL